MLETAGTDCSGGRVRRAGPSALCRGTAAVGSKRPPGAFAGLAGDGYHALLVPDTHGGAG